MVLKKSQSQMAEVSVSGSCFSVCHLDPRLANSQSGASSQSLMNDEGIPDEVFKAESADMMAEHLFIKSS